MGIISSIKERLAANANEEESVIKRRGMEQWHRPGDVSEQGKEQYKREISEMSLPEREKERKMRIQENKGMSEWHTGGSQVKQNIKKGGTIGIHAEKEPETFIQRKNREYFEQQGAVKRFAGEFQGKERKEVEARIRGFRSAKEEKELNIRKAHQTFEQSAKRDYELHYDPASRYKETTQEIKDKIESAKLKAKKLATPAGLAGGLINVISPIKTRDEKIKEEREKALQEQKTQNRRELLEERQFQIEKAAAYGSGRIPRQKVVIKRVRVGTSPLRGAFGMGGFSLSRRPQRPMQEVISRGQPQAVKPVERPSEPFGLSQYSGTPRPVVRQPSSVRPTEIRIAGTEQRRPKRSVEYIPAKQINPVNDTSGNFLVSMGGMNVGSSPVTTKKKTASNNDPTGASRYWQ